MADLKKKKNNHPEGRAPNELLEERGNSDDNMECVTQICALFQPHGRGSDSGEEETMTPKRLKWQEVSSKKINMRKY